MGEALSLFDLAPRAPSPAPELVVPPAADNPGHGLRPYQVDCKRAIFEKLREARSTLAVLSTGLGKTTIFCSVAADWPGRVLILAHRYELIEQAHLRAREMLGEYVGVEQAGYWAGGERVVVGSVQTLVSKRRRERFVDNPFALIIVDEAHHTNAESYRQILGAFPSAKILGVTATPDRGDGLALGDIYETEAYRRDILDGIDDGYLAPVRVKTERLREVNLSAVKTTAGDLNIGQLDEEMAKVNEVVAKKCLELCGDRKTIVFSTKVQTAHDLAEVFNRESGGRMVARAVDGAMDVDTRKAVLRGHKRGDFQFLINVGIATEGYDSPDVSCVAIARPTKSRALYTQMAGRGLRVLPGLVERIEEAEGRRAAIAASAKPDCLLLDFAGNAGRHALVSPLDILGGRYDEETRERAKKDTEKKAMGSEEALRAAKAAIEAEREERRRAIRNLRSNVRSEMSDVDPFDRARGQQPDGEPMPEAKIWKPTGGQIEALTSFGLKDADIPPTMKAASDLIAKLKVRRARKLASWRQMKCLQRYGIDAERMYGRTASAIIDGLSANDWKPLAPAALDALIKDATGLSRTEEG